MSWVDVLNQHLTELVHASRQLIEKRRYGRRYREYVLASHRHVDRALPRIVTPHALELDELFVDLFLTFHKAVPAPGSVLADVPSRISRRHSINEFLDGEEPVVLAIVGAPGSGKTTLLRHVALRAAKREQLPILLTVRDHAGEFAQESPVSLPDLLETTLQDLGPAPDGWWDAELRHGNCLVLLDGLDEVADDQDLTGVINWIEHQIEVYPRNHFVITARPHGYRTAAISAADVLQVLPFEEAQIQRFVHAWCLAVEQRTVAGDPGAAPDRARRRAADLLKRLAGAPGLYDLAVNPLLLTMIVNVHHYASALPGSRADLYRRIFRVMLRNPPESENDPHALRPADKERVLAALAFAMMKREVRDLPRQDVLENIASSLRRSRTIIDPKDFLAGIERSGLLIERERSSYAFAHHTFAEYLAATHIRDNRHSRLLMKKVANPWWRETTLLYVTDADADPIVRACLNSNTITALALAFDCVQQSDALAPELRARLETIRADAFREGADPEHRRLVAGVLATRHLRSTETRGTVCPRRVTQDLYWLFVQDAGAPPDGPVELTPDPSQPVVGLWGGDALRFTEWLNTVIGAGLPACRLPTDEEVRGLSARPTAATAWLDESRTGVWTRPDPGAITPGLWISDHNRDPRTVDGRDVLDATIADATDSLLLPRLELINARLLVHILDDTLTHGLDYDHVRAIRDTLVRTLEPDLADLLSHDFAHDPNVARALEQARTVAIERAQAFERAQSQARSTDPRLIPGLALDRDLTRVLGPDPVLDLDSARKRAMGVALARACQATGYEGLPDRRAADAFAASLIHSAGISDGYATTVNLDGLAETAHVACAALIHRDADPASWPATVAGRLQQAAEPIFSRTRRLTPEYATVIRLPALALAADADTRQMRKVADGFRTVAAGITLLQRRAAGEAPLETIILARA